MGCLETLIKALECFTKATEEDPNNAQAYINLGITYNQTGKQEKAQAAFQQARRIDPNSNIPGQ